MIPKRTSALPITEVSFKPEKLKPRGEKPITYVFRNKREHTCFINADQECKEELLAWIKKTDLPRYICSH
jgi:hypothetical protein